MPEQECRHSKTIPACNKCCIESEWQLPFFQRPLVWKPSQGKMLIESIIRRFPIGTVIIWKRPPGWTDYTPLHIVPLPSSAPHPVLDDDGKPVLGDDGEPVLKGRTPSHLIIDGQQRLTTLAQQQHLSTFEPAEWKNLANVDVFTVDVTRSLKTARTKNLISKSVGHHKAKDLVKSGKGRSEFKLNPETYPLPLIIAEQRRYNSYIKKFLKDKKLSKSEIKNIASIRECFIDANFKYPEILIQEVIIAKNEIVDLFQIANSQGTNLTAIDHASAYLFEPPGNGYLNGRIDDACKNIVSNSNLAEPHSMRNWYCRSIFFLLFGSTDPKVVIHDAEKYRKAPPDEIQDKTYKFLKEHDKFEKAVTKTKVKSADRQSERSFRRAMHFLQNDFNLTSLKKPKVELSYLIPLAIWLETQSEGTGKTSEAVPVEERRKIKAWFSFVQLVKYTSGGSTEKEYDEAANVAQSGDPWKELKAILIDPEKGGLQEDPKTKLLKLTEEHFVEVTKKRKTGELELQSTPSWLKHLILMYYVCRGTVSWTSETAISHERVREKTFHDHHIFPEDMFKEKDGVKGELFGKSYLKNHIANKTWITSYTNTKQKAQRPELYVSDLIEDGKGDILKLHNMSDDVELYHPEKYEDFLKDRLDSLISGVNDMLAAWQRGDEPSFKNQYKSSRLESKEILKQAKKRVKQGLPSEEQKVEFKTSYDYDSTPRPVLGDDGKPILKGGKPVLKKGRRRFPKDTFDLRYVLCKEVVGFANATSGTLMVGIDDDANVVGLENDQELLGKERELETTVLNFIKSHIEPKEAARFPQLSVKEEIINNKKVLRIDIRRWAGVDKKGQRERVRVKDPKTKKYRPAKRTNSVCEWWDEKSSS